MMRYELVDKPQKAVHNFPGVIDRSRKDATVEPPVQTESEKEVAVEKPKRSRKTATEKPKAVPFAKGKVI